MYVNKLYFDSAIKYLENTKTVLVRFSYYNGVVRNDDDEIGEISSRIMDKLINSGRFRFIGNGTGLLNHEKYYKLKL